MRVSVITVALALANVAHADLVAAPAAPEQKPEPELKTSAAPKKPKGNQRALCGCASSRFLARGPVTLDAATTLPVWLHGEAHVEGFARDDTQRLVPASLPFAVTEFAGAHDGASRLVKVSAAGAGSGFVGVVRPNDASPREALAVTLVAPASTEASGPAPKLTAMWLAAPEVRERKDCGPTSAERLTERLAFELAEGSPAVEAFVIKDNDSGESTVVDARHVGAFGIGRVDVCDHGFVVETTAQNLTITPLSATWAAGEPWGFSHDATGADPKRTASPSTADDDLIDQSFPVPGTPTKPMSLLSVGGVWSLTIVGGGVCGLIGFAFWRLKKRRMTEVRCTKCNAKIPVDALDDKVDGFFCPSCGTAGLWRNKDGHMASTVLPDA